MKFAKKFLSAIVFLAVVFLLSGCNRTEENKTKNIYKITFDSSGGSAVFNQEVEEGSLITKPADPTKEGYTFAGWEYEGNIYNFTTTVSKDMILVAKWTQGISSKTYRVSFNSNGGSTVYSVSVKSGEKVTKPTDPTKEGYIFKYWSLNDEEYNFDSVVTENIELKAIWEEDAANKTYIVTFDSDNGDELVTQEVQNGKKAVAPKNPTKKGYVFLDWYLDSKVYNFSTKVTKDISLKAKWAKEGNYEITFNSDGGTEVEAQTVAAGKLVTKPTNVTKEGFVLKEWQLKGKTYDFNTKVSENMELKAIWELPKFTVTFNSDGGSTVKSQSVEINKKATKPANPTKTGYDFKEWQLDGVLYNFDDPVTKEITLKAVWTPKKYTVTFNSDGGSEVASQEVEYNGTATQPANPTKDGYEFKEWQLNNKKFVFTTKITGNITLKAVWTKDTKTYTFKVKSIDPYSPDRIVEVYENGNKVSFTSIKVNGNQICCTGANTAVNFYDIADVTSITVVLTNGKTVTATLSN